MRSLRFRNCSARLLAAALTLLAAAAPAAAQVADTAHAADSLPVKRAPQKTFFTRRDLAWTAGALAGSAVLSTFDKRIANWSQQPSVQGSTARHDVVDVATKFNETPLAIGAIATWGIGRLAHSSTTADVGAHLTEALLLTDVISEAVRGPIGRARPRVSPDDQYQFDFGKGFTKFENRAFPSLHSASAFAAAAALVGEIRERKPDALWYSAPLLYGAAAIPGLTRIYLNQHWASDVVAGAFVGTLIGSRVVSYAHSHRRSRIDRLLLGTTVVPDRQGGALVMFQVNTR